MGSATLDRAFGGLPPPKAGSAKLKHALQLAGSPAVPSARVHSPENL